MLCFVQVRDKYTFAPPLVHIATKELTWKKQSIKRWFSYVVFLIVSSFVVWVLGFWSSKRTRNCEDTSFSSPISCLLVPPLMDTNSIPAVCPVPRPSRTVDIITVLQVEVVRSLTACIRGKGVAQLVSERPSELEAFAPSNALCMSRCLGRVGQSLPAFQSNINRLNF